MNRRGEILKKPFALFLIICCLIPFLCACQAPTADSGQDASSAAAYTQITAEEAIQMMESESDYIILDVRRQDEFDAGHIPNAVCIPNESIGTDPIPALPDQDQLILVYCRSGRRSKEAAQKLADLGYTHIVEFGGIIDWPGETVTEDQNDPS